MGPGTERVAKFVHWHQGNRADRRKHLRGLCSRCRLRSLFIEIIQRTGIGCQQRRRSPEPANLVGRFEPSRPVDNGNGYVGLSSPTYGTLTVFRQNSLTYDGVLDYDPMGASYAFSPIGWQGITLRRG